MRRFSLNPCACVSSPIHSFRNDRGDTESCDIHVIDNHQHALGEFQLFVAWFRNCAPSVVIEEWLAGVAIVSLIEGRIGNGHGEIELELKVRGRLS